MSSLTKQELADVFVLHLKDAADELMYAAGSDGEPDRTKPQRVHIYGPGTKQGARAQAERNGRTIERMQRKGKMKMSADETMQDRAEYAAAVTKSFENIDSDKGATGDDLFMEVYLNPKLVHLVEQVEAGARSYANFSKASTAS